MTRIRRIARAVALVAVGASLGACPEAKKAAGPHPQAIPSPPKEYPADADGLRALWSDILVAGQRDDREKVHDLMASMIMTDEDLVAVFGSERAAYLKPRYQPMIARLVNIGALELVAQIAEKKYDDIEVIPVEASQGAEQKATLEVLKAPLAVFAVRMKKKNETRGLRYDFFVYRDGRWVTGNQIAKYLVPVDNVPSATLTARPPTSEHPDAAAVPPPGRASPGTPRPLPR